MMYLQVIFYDKKGRNGSAEYPIENQEQGKNHLIRIKSHRMPNERIEYQITNKQWL